MVAIAPDGEYVEIMDKDYLCTLMMTYDPPLIEFTDLVIQTGAYWRGDAALGYLFPLQLGPVNDDCEIAIQLPPVPSADEGDYELWLYQAVSRDVFVSDLSIGLTVDDASGTWTGPLTEPVHFEPVDAGNPVNVVLDFTCSSSEEDTEVNPIFSVFLAVGLLRTPVEGDPEAAALAWRGEPPLGSALLLTAP